MSEIQEQSSVLEQINIIFRNIILGIIIQGTLTAVSNNVLTPFNIHTFYKTDYVRACVRACVCVCVRSCEHVFIPTRRNLNSFLDHTLKYNKIFPSDTFLFLGSIQKIQEFKKI